MFATLASLLKSGAALAGPAAGTASAWQSVRSIFGGGGDDSGLTPAEASVKLQRKQIEFQREQGVLERRFLERQLHEQSQLKLGELLAQVIAAKHLSPDQPIVYQTPPAPAEYSFFDKINLQIHKIFASF